jgi:hypothetical protein
MRAPYSLLPSVLQCCTYICFRFSYSTTSVLLHSTRAWVRRLPYPRVGTLRTSPKTLKLANSASLGIDHVWPIHPSCCPFLVLDNTSRLHMAVYVNLSPTVANFLEYALLRTSVTRLSLTMGALAYLVWYYPNYICRGNLVYSNFLPWRSYD